MGYQFSYAYGSKLAPLVQDQSFLLFTVAGLINLLLFHLLIILCTLISVMRSKKLLYVRLNIICYDLMQQHLWHWRQHIKSYIFKYFSFSLYGLALVVFPFLDKFMLSFFFWGLSIRKEAELRFLCFPYFDNLR